VSSFVGNDEAIDVPRYGFPTNLNFRLFHETSTSGKVELTHLTISRAEVRGFPWHVVCSPAFTGLFQGEIP
jgi:hypothetical protein